LYNNKQLALGNSLTPKDSKRITSNVDEIKQYVWRVMAFNEGEKGGASGTGVAIAKNFIATNCHVVLDYKLTEKRNNPQYYDVILVENLHDENKGGSVKLFKKGYEKDLDICILKTKSDLKYIKTKIKYKKLKQRMKVMAMGNPKGIIGHTSDGKITALETWETDIVHPLINKNPIELKNPWKIIHHDAAIGQGSSGGPLFDAAGNLIGINTLAETEGTTGSFAIALSADHINDVLRD
jgi:S1-C subfamily serine protease